MKEQILLFHFQEDARRSAVRKALLPLHIACKEIPQEQWEVPIGALAGLAAQPQPQLETRELSEEVLILCGLSDDALQQAVMALRKAGLYLPYKAVLTPTNKDWTVRQLFCELYREHEMMQQMAKAKD